jgi:translation initiation factor 6 (eIF-6)
VESITMGKMIYFPINNDGVMVSLKVWDGEIEPIGKLKDVWVQVRGIPPNGVIGQCSSR